MSSHRKKRVLMTKVGLDGHDRGLKVVSAYLREAGMEVIYLGRFQTPESIVRTAIQEDVDVIGVSCLDGEHVPLTPRIIKLLKDNDADRISLVLGGVIPREDVPTLKDMGVDAVFPSGSSLENITDTIKGLH
ncbi:MAG: cobalamin B12-binding domain-containing protein [Chloroflexota bacterium]|nr:cobalamin B12-binding domain-containing protein [Chloroflexota bacterium]